MKGKYIMMPILIQGSKQLGNDIDVFLEPLMEDFATLWNQGVEAWDEYKRQYFQLRAMVFVTSYFFYIQVVVVRAVATTSICIILCTNLRHNACIFYMCAWTEVQFCQTELSEATHEISIL